MSACAPPPARASPAMGRRCSAALAAAACALAARRVGAATALTAGAGSIYMSPHPVGRSVLVDWGARNGDSLRSMLLHVREDATMHTHFDVAHTFEARPEYNAKWRATVASSSNPSVNFYNFAVWTENTTLTFSDNDFSSSAIQTHDNAKDFQAKPSLKVAAMDAATWLSANVRPEDDVTVKVDIELAEIPVFQRLIETGAVALLDTIYYECHYYEMTGLDKTITRDVCAQQCRDIVAAAPNARFFFWSRINQRRRRQEEGFQWLAAYGIAANDCTVLDTQFKTPARLASERGAVYAAFTLLGAAAAVRVAWQRRAGERAGRRGQGGV